MWSYGYLIRCMSSLYNGSRAWVKLGSRMGEYFEVRRGLRQPWCVMSLWLFNLFDRVIRRVNERAMGNGVKLRDKNGVGWETRENLQHIASEFERVCDCVGLKISVGKSKVLTIKKDEMGSCEKVRVNGEEMQEVDKLNYLGVMIGTDGGVGEEVAHRVVEGRKVWGTMAKLWKENVIWLILFMVRKRGHQVHRRGEKQKYLRNICGTRHKAQGEWTE